MGYSIRVETNKVVRIVFQDRLEISCGIFDEPNSPIEVYVSKSNITWSRQDLKSFIEFLDTVLDEQKDLWCLPEDDSEDNPEIKP